uniref:Uncharacterized protein n=1 Tax=Salix viminalis TaxID=40686 RepID=A0A6N2KXZ9_SALVM
MTSFSLSSKAYTARDFILEAKKNPQTTFSSYFVFDRNSGWVKFRTTTTTNKYKANTHVEKASKGGFNNNVWVNQLAKSFKIDKSVNRLKPAVAFSVPLGECYMLIDIPMSNYINSGINKISVLARSN